MPPKAKKPTRKRKNSGIDTRKLETLIREAVRSELISQSSRTQTTESYTKRLQDTDSKVTNFIEQAINETTRAYRLAIDGYRVNQYAAFSVLAFGLILAVVNIGNVNLLMFSSLFIGIGIFWRNQLQNRNLSKNFRSLVNNLAKLNIIFASYMRQIHQVDAVFENYVGKNDGITIQDAEQLLNNLQDTMTEAMTAVTAINIESDD